MAQTFQKETLERDIVLQHRGGARYRDFPFNTITGLLGIFFFALSLRS